VTNGEKSPWMTKMVGIADSVKPPM
jgi:hypothetical protein